MTEDPFIIREGDIKDPNLKAYVKSHEEGNFFNFRQTDTVQRLGQYIDHKKLKTFYFILSAIFLIIFVRILFLQIINGDNYRLIAEGNRIRLERQKAERGIFYDRNGKILVLNKSTFSLYLTPAIFFNGYKDTSSTVNEINKIINLPEQDLNDLINTAPKNSYLPILIKEDLLYEEAIKLKIKTQNISGFSVEDENYRSYPDGQIFGHLLGYMSKISEKEYKDQKNDEYSYTDKIGRAGMELIYENDLKGTDGYRDIEVDSLGKEKKIISQKDFVTGKNFILTIDADLQKKLYETLDKELKIINRTKASAIALNPQNGEILAMVSFPSYDNNLFSIKIKNEDYQKLINDQDLPLFNRPISGEYPSGSVIKPVVAAAGLEEGVIDENYQVLSTGGIAYGSWFFPDWKAGGHGLTNVIKALAESVNTFFYLVGIDNYNGHVGLGVDRLTNYMKKFNFGEKTNIDLPNEQSGFVPTPAWKEQAKGESWYPGDTFHLAIGQGDLLVTPLQIAVETSYFASNGKTFQPHLVKEIFSNQGKLDIQPKIILNDIIKPVNTDIVREGMKACVIQGSCRILTDLPVESGAKTGTAQVNNNKDTHAWFTAFAPFTNSQIVLTIMIENGGEGSSVAAPVANEVLKWYFQQHNP